ncbi:transmembrane signal receptor [Lithospermum erythrorhizon]|uniref:Transmembrane signal receptor n=1 Tax=Lithospermum erythrorhizon TaxID=34254 RepID=A0AAV3QRK9_LITER
MRFHKLVLVNQDEITPNEVENIVTPNEVESNVVPDANILPDSNALNDYQLTSDRSKRTIKMPERYKDNNLNDCNLSVFSFNVFESLECDEPKTYKEALSCSVVDCKWLFKVKQETNKVRFKAKLVAKGFTQKEGIDYAEIFAPVVKFTTVRIMLVLVAHFNWELKQMDVTTAFLHGDLDKNIYIHQPEGFVDPKLPDNVCLLKKALYGLKQSPRKWNIKFDNCMQSLKFKRSSSDHCLYFKNIDSVSVFLLLYVDDLLIVSPCLKSIEHVQKCLCDNFDMKDLGDAKKILGMNIIRDRKKSTLVLNQSAYVQKILSKFSMSDAKSVNVPLASHFVLSKDQSLKTETEINDMKNVPYSNTIGSVMYLMVSTRPDIAYAVSCLSRYMSNPGMPHWNALKWLLRYLKSTVDVGLSFSRYHDGIKLVGYVDSNYANDRNNRKSTTSYVFTLSATEAFKEAIWLRALLSEIGFLDKHVVVFSDSQSAIQLCKNPVFHDRTKHIDVRFHYIRDIVEQGIVKLEKIPSEFNHADMGTKCLSMEKFISCQRIMNFDID